MLFSEAVKGKTFKCDSCKETFLGETIKLISTPKNINSFNLLAEFKFVDKDGKIMGGNKGPDGNIGDQIANCPLCNYSHFFGFDLVTK